MAGSALYSEWTTACARQYPGTEAAIQKKADAMCVAIPDCLVEGYEPLIHGLKLSDPDDRHVLAAAIAAHLQDAVDLL